MKCQNCGKEEVNFHYKSNYNGNVTEKHLCLDCAEKLGLMNNSMFKPEISFGEIFDDMFGMRPVRRMLSGYGMMFPTFVMPPVGFVVPQHIYGCGIKAPAEDAASAEERPQVTPEVDGEMKKRRELNILREQMRAAAEAEDFEKAAELRDKIKKIEDGNKKS